MKKLFSSKKYNTLSGLVEFLVALPLCLSKSFASGAPFFSVSIAGFIGGVNAASVSNSKLSVRCKLCNPDVVTQMWNNSKYQYIPFMVTVLTILLIDLCGLFKPLKGEGLLICVVAASGDNISTPCQS